MVYRYNGKVHLPVEPKSEKEDEVGEAILPPLGSIELTIAWWLTRWPFVRSGGGEGELVLLGRLASELLLLLTLIVTGVWLPLVVDDGPKASSWSRLCVPKKALLK